VASTPVNNGQMEAPCIGTAVAKFYVE